MGGVFTGKNEVIENDNRIANQSHSSTAPTSATETVKHRPN
jgi:hypothetical protein